MRPVVPFLAFLVACHGPAAAQKTETKMETAPAATASERPVDVGDRAPTFDLAAIDGTRARIQPGKVNIVFFWATWSEPDKKSMPKLQDILVRHGSAGVAILGLSVDDEPRGVADFARTYGAHFAIAWDAERAVAGRYRPEAEPTYYVLDRNGIVRFRHHGYHDGEAEVIEREVVSLLESR